MPLSLLNEKLLHKFRALNKEEIQVLVGMKHDLNLNLCIYSVIWSQMVVRMGTLQWGLEGWSKVLEQKGENEVIMRWATEAWTLLYRTKAGVKGNQSFLFISFCLRCDHPSHLRPQNWNENHLISCQQAYLMTSLVNKGNTDTRSWFWFTRTLGGGGEFGSFSLPLNSVMVTVIKEGLRTAHNDNSSSTSTSDSRPDLCPLALIVDSLSICCSADRKRVTGLWGGTEQRGVPPSCCVLLREERVAPENPLLCLLP